MTTKISRRAFLGLEAIAEEGRPKEGSNEKDRTIVIEHFARRYTFSAYLKKLYTAFLEGYNKDKDKDYIV